MTIFNPDNDIEVYLVAFVAICSLLGIVIPAWINQRKKIDEIRDHVSNDHEPNMREEMDERHEAIIEALGDLKRDIGGIREELRTERIERINGDQAACATRKGACGGGPE